MMTITVCIGSSCHLKGSYNVVTELEELIKKNNLENDVTLQASFCSGSCTNAVCIRINDDPIQSITPENIKDFFNEQVLERLNK